MGGKYLAIGLILLIVGGAIAYIVKAKKSGQKCIGCPHSQNCSGGCSCGSNNIKEKININESVL